MCGRFTLALPPEILASVFGLSAAPQIEPRWNIAPSQKIAVVRQDASGSRVLEMMKWGLIPHWVKEQAPDNHLINARCETAHEKPSFRQSIRSRRCIVPASGFYEWCATPHGKAPHYITHKDGAPLPMAAIWDSWQTPDGQNITTCAILTTAPNAVMANIHNRMPVILHRSEFDLWLDRSVNDSDELKRLYQPYPADLMRTWQVSTAVNSTYHDSSDCVAPYNPPSQPQTN